MHNDVHVARSCAWPLRDCNGIRYDFIPTYVLSVQSNIKYANGFMISAARVARGTMLVSMLPPCT